jgi:hypothetical protein
VETLVAAYADGAPVVLGLEVPHGEHGALKSYMDSDGGRGACATAIDVVLVTCRRPARRSPQPRHAGSGRRVACDASAWPRCGRAALRSRPR